MSSKAQKTPPPGVDKAEFCRTCAKFPTGVTIVTVLDAEGSPHGMTASSFTSVSLDPPLIAICVDLRSQTLSRLRTSGFFAVNVLEASQEALSRCFATSSVERSESFCHVPYHVAVTGSPVLSDVLAFLDARMVAEYPGGDHAIILDRGRIVHAGLAAELLNDPQRLSSLIGVER